MQKTHYCPICDKYLPLHNFYVRKRGGPAGRCKPCANRLSYLDQEKKYFKRKMELISLFGSACTICGYNKNLAALCFHHKDPGMKEFKIDRSNIHGRSMNAILAELKSCTLLCSNCHMEEHYPKLTINT